MEIDEIFEEFKNENPNLELIRAKSVKKISLIKILIVIYSITTIVSIPFANIITIILFVGIIPFVLFLHFFSESRMDFEKQFEKVIPKYLQKLLWLTNSNAQYSPSIDDKIAKESLFFSNNLGSFIIESKHQILFRNEKKELMAFTIDFKHPNSKNRIIDFHWKESFLIHQDFKIGLKGKNLLIPKSYFSSHNAEEDSDNFNRIMPLKGLKEKENDPLNQMSYLWFTDNKLQTYVSEECINKVKWVSEHIFIKNKKFISINNESMYILVFDKSLFKAPLKKSILANNFFETYQSDLDAFRSP